MGLGLGLVATLHKEKARPAWLIRINLATNSTEKISATWLIKIEHQTSEKSLHTIFAAPKCIVYFKR